MTAKFQDTYEDMKDNEEIWRKDNRLLNSSTQSNHFVDCLKNKYRCVQQFPLQTHREVGTAILLQEYPHRKHNTDPHHTNQSYDSHRKRTKQVAHTLCVEA